MRGEGNSDGRVGEDEEMCYACLVCVFFWLVHFVTQIENAEPLTLPPLSVSLCFVVWKRLDGWEAFKGDPIKFIVNEVPWGQRWGSGSGSGSGS